MEKRCFLTIKLIAILMLSSQLVFCEEKQVDVKTGATNKSPNELSEGLNKGREYKEKAFKKEVVSSKELVRMAWEASAKNEEERLEGIVKECLTLYGKEAKEQQKFLKSFPPRGDETLYQSLNDVGVCLFVRAEFYLYHGRPTEDVVKAANEAIENYSWSQAWDPSRGSYWSVAEKCQEVIDTKTGKRQERLNTDREIVPIILPKLHTKGTEDIIDYSKYGKFVGVGTENYKYSIADIEGLAAALGEGIYPNTASIYNNPRYKELKKAGKLKGVHWDFVNVTDLESAYFKWATAPEPWGVRLFYIGLIFEKAGMYYEALKAYNALLVHFPKTVAWTYWQTPWYPGQAAVAKIRHIIRTHPELKVEDSWMKIVITNGFDNDEKNDKIVTYPGQLIKKDVVDTGKDKLNLGEKELLENPITTLGKGVVQLVQYNNGHWQMLVDGKPYIIKGITYDPTMVGQTPDKGTLENWMEEDINKNGKIDGPYETWVDKNRNNKRDEDEPIVGDFQLLKDMGVNTMRFYSKPDIKINKELLRDMYENYGIRVIMGNFLGKYAIGSGASWSEGTDYENPEHKLNMLEDVKKMVLEHKDEPYVLMWLLGNENNYGVASNGDSKPQAYFKFADEVAQLIKSIDKNHPVALCNGDTKFLDIFAQYSPNIDVFAANIYRGDYGFGAYWQQVFDATGKPAFITEYGCPAFSGFLSLEDAEQVQADYHMGNWLDIQENSAGYVRGVGNSIGGVVFEWTDEWWKNYDPFLHDMKADVVGPFPGGYYFEEWFGITAQGDGRSSPFLRQLRKAYFLYKELWN